jgi:hypothetical protein
MAQFFHPSVSPEKFVTINNANISGKKVLICPLPRISRIAMN